MREKPFGSTGGQYEWDKYISINRVCQKWKGFGESRANVKFILVHSNWRYVM